ncbi:hydrogen peroxide-inducible genes activator [Actibacterium sp. 188UL27-1]|uniref:hydrogen peroxide-inducible genes activator n=1 Tax=Actibacterium sp. 188UL27-1 TaxID=2786961 RepID=UPI001956E9C4|nr:hydrogen peroxide-inducible genes activator [Actibacterium sp. 188UL27-1]MBM7066826.1 hydrogen peroxide-inducible genes activator [Actibacterium sp. 188UL27-1]
MSTSPSLRQLRYLIALSEARHFRKAAQNMGISQPSLSLQIGNLEDLLGLRLFERGRGPVTLTPEGREVLIRARRATEEVRAIVDLASALKTGMAGTIRLGTTPTIGPYLLPFVVERLHAQYPDLRLYIRENAPRDLREELLGGNLDVILTQLPEAGADLAARRLFREPLLLAVPADHPLAVKSEIAGQDLTNLNVLSLGPAYKLHSQIAALCSDYGAVLARDYEGTSLDALRQMVGMGMGVAFLPRLYIRSEIDARRSNVVVLPFRKNAIQRAVGLVWRAGANPALFERLSDTISQSVAHHMQALKPPIVLG